MLKTIIKLCTYWVSFQMVVSTHSQHLFEICRLAQKAGVRDVYVHAFTDGRDTDPKSGKRFLEELEKTFWGKNSFSL